MTRVIIPLVGNPPFRTNVRDDSGPPVGKHRPQLVDEEGLATSADPLLPIDNGSTESYPDRKDAEEQERCRQHGQDQAPDKVDRGLHPSFVGARVVPGGQLDQLRRWRLDRLRKTSERLRRRVRSNYP